MGRRSETVLRLQIFFMPAAVLWYVHQSSHNNNERKGLACSDHGRYEGCVDSPMTPIAVRMVSFETMVGGASELCFALADGSEREPVVDSLS